MYKVIIVDDEPMIKRTLHKLIHQNALFSVIGEAEDGQGALELFETHRPDIIFTDIRMPVMDGLELIKRVKEIDPSVEIVVISGYDDFSYAQQALRSGTADYLLKPIEPEALAAALDGLAGRFRAKKEGYRHHSEWLEFCRDSAEKVFNHLWLLDEQEAMEEMELFHRKLETAPADKEFHGAMYADMFRCLLERLDEKGNFGIHFDDRFEDATSKGLEDLHRYAVERLLHIQSTLRQRSNWHNRNSMNIAKQYIEEHYTQEHLSLQEAAEVVGMSPSYFSRIFKEEFGLSFIQFVTRLRMEESARQLSDPLCKTYEISHNVGYSDYSHFAKVFKKHYAVSPTEYKKRLETT